MLGSWFNKVTWGIAQSIEQWKRCIGGAILVLLVSQTYMPAPCDWSHQIAEHVNSCGVVPYSIIH